MQDPITRGVRRYVSSRYNHRCGRILVQAALEYGEIVGGVAKIGGESMGFTPWVAVAEAPGPRCRRDALGTGYRRGGGNRYLGK